MFFSFDHVTCCCKKGCSLRSVTGLHSSTTSFVYILIASSHCRLHRPTSVWPAWSFASGSFSLSKHLHVVLFRCLRALFLFNYQYITCILSFHFRLPVFVSATLVSQVLYFASDLHLFCLLVFTWFVNRKYFFILIWLPFPATPAW